MIRQIDNSLITGPDKKYFLQSKFLKHTTAYPLSADWKDGKCKLNSIRVHYFFSATRNIDDMLKTALVDLRLTEGSDSDSPTIFQGNALLLQDFFPSYIACPNMVAPKLSYLFAPKADSHVTIQIIVGLACDGPVETENLTLYKHDSQNYVYFADDSFYTSHPFPDAWIEMFRTNDIPKLPLSDSGYMPILTDRAIVPKSPVNEKRRIMEKMRRTIATQGTGVPSYALKLTCRGSLKPETTKPSQQLLLTVARRKIRRNAPPLAMTYVTAVTSPHSGTHNTWSPPPLPPHEIREELVRALTLENGDKSGLEDERPRMLDSGRHLGARPGTVPAVVVTTQMSSLEERLGGGDGSTDSTWIQEAKQATSAAQTKKHKKKTTRNADDRYTRTLQFI